MHSFCRFSQGSNMCTCTQYKVQKSMRVIQEIQLVNLQYEDEETLQFVISIKK